MHPGITLSEQVAAQLLASIEGGRLAPGTRLPSERELGERFGVSRTVVREALRSLAACGAVEVRNGALPQVTAISAEHVAQVLRLHVRTAATDDDVETLRQLLIAGAVALDDNADLTPAERVRRRGGPLAKLILDACEA